MSSDEGYDCPGCEKSGFSGPALRVHRCSGLGGVQLSIEQWMAAVEITRLKRAMLRERSNRRLQTLRGELARNKSLFERKGAMAA